MATKKTEKSIKNIAETEPFKVSDTFTKVSKGEDIIQLRGISKQYDTKFVVKNINLNIKKGEFVTILGPSGCGKTTTLRMIAGFELPTEGSILFNGEDIAGLPPYKRNVNTVFQKYALFPHLNVFNNVAFGLKLKKVPVTIINKKTNEETVKLVNIKNTIVDQTVTAKDGTVSTKQVKFKNQYKIVTKTIKGKTVTTKVNCYKEYIKEKVKRALKIVGLSDYETRDVNSLSGGQQQRVAIARAIINEPEILLLDEPLGALDLKMRQEMQLELKSMHDKLGITFIYVTHDQEEALTMSDTVIVMRDGKIIQEGSPIDIYNEPTNAYVADFIGESNIIDGVMLEDKKVFFAGSEVECVDTGFEKNEKIDVVIRPEDIEIVAPGKGFADGKIISCMFRGVHYEMECIANGYEFTIQNTKECPVDSIVGLSVIPDNIHIMKKEIITNTFKVSFSSDNTISLHNGDYEFDPITLFGEEKTGLKGVEAIVTVDFNKIDMTDSEFDAPIAGNVESMIYKGKNYLVSIRLDNDHHILADTEYLWDDGDRVGVKINKTDFKLVKLLDQDDANEFVADNEE